MPIFELELKQKLKLILVYYLPLAAILEVIIQFNTVWTYRMLLVLPVVVLALILLHGLYNILIHFMLSAWIEYLMEAVHREEIFPEFNVEKNNMMQFATSYYSFTVFTILMSYIGANNYLW